MAWRGVALAGAVDVVGWWREVGRKRRSVDGRWKLSMPFASYVSAFFFFFIIFGGLEFFPEPELLDFYPVLFFLPSLPHPLTRIRNQKTPSARQRPSPFILLYVHRFLFAPRFSLSREREKREFQGTFHSEIGCAQIQFDRIPNLNDCGWSNIVSFQSFSSFSMIESFFPQRSIPLVQTDGLLFRLVVYQQHRRDVVPPVTGRFSDWH